MATPVKNIQRVNACNSMLPQPAFFFFANRRHLLQGFLAYLKYLTGKQYLPFIRPHKVLSLLSGVVQCAVFIFPLTFVLPRSAKISLSLFLTA